MELLFDTGAAQVLKLCRIFLETPSKLPKRVFTFC
jgi:hypothetical protein